MEITTGLFSQNKIKETGTQFPVSIEFIDVLLCLFLIQILEDLSDFFF